MQEIELTHKLTWWRSDLIIATLAYNLTLGLGLLVLVHVLVNNSSVSAVPEILFYGGLLLVLLMLNAAFDRSRQKIMYWTERRNFFQRIYTSFLISPVAVAQNLYSADALSDSRRFLISSILIDSIRIPAIIILLAFISTELASVVSIMILILLVLALYQGSKMRHAFCDQQELAQQMDTIQRESLRNYQTIKLLGMEKLVLRRYERHCYNNGFNVNASVLLGLTIQDAYLIWQTFFLACVVLLLGKEYTQSHLALDQVILVLLLMAVLLSPIRTVLSHWDDIIRSYMSPSPPESQIHTDNHHVSAVDLDGSVVLQDVDFKYPNAHSSVLNQATLTIQPRTLVTVYGQSGSGKTTLAKLIKGDLVPDSGKIVLGDHSFDDNMASLSQDQIIYLSSDPQLYVGTILENLTLFKIGPLLDEAVKLSQQLGLESWVKTQPLGYQTPIFDSLDTTVPSGIKQRIGLIRCLLQEPKILILDEANSYLDDPGDSALKTILTEMKEGMTIIFITHRPSFKKIADDSYDLVNGQLLPSLNVEIQPEAIFKPAFINKMAGDL